MQDVSPPRQPRIKKYVLEALPQGGPAPAYILLDAKCNQFIINLGPPGGGGSSRRIKWCQAWNSQEIAEQAVDSKTCKFTFKKSINLDLYSYCKSGGSLD